MQKISVIVPVFNREDKISRCLDSILNQSYRNLEIICVDDKSTDGSLRILNEYADNDERIKVIALDKNVGVSTARNIGLDNATGEWIAFVDSDDYIDKNMYEEMLLAANSSGAEIVLSGLDIIQGKEHNETKIELTPNKKYCKEIIFSEILPLFTSTGKYNLVLFSFSTKLYSRKLLERKPVRFSDGILYQEDKLFVIEVFALCESLIYIDKAFYKYEPSAEGLYSTFREESWHSYVKLYCKFKALIKDYSIKNIHIESIYEDFAYNITWFLYRSNRIKDTKKRKKLQNEVIHNNNVQMICNEIAESLTSFEKRMINAILSGNRFFAISMINFVYSGKKDRLIQVINRVKR